MARSPAPIVGIVPAAGRAARLPDRTCSKELLPVCEVRTEAGPRVKVISEYTVDAMVDAGAERICIVIAPNKQDIKSYYGSGEAYGRPFAYFSQATPTGMPDAIDIAYSALRDAVVLMGMPDTVTRPSGAMKRLRQFYDRGDADVAIAVLPADEPERLGPVLFEPSGRVTRILDKPAKAPHNLVWTMACWGSAFTEFLHHHLATATRIVPETPLGLIFQAALEQGLRVRALPFGDGAYVDAGTTTGLEAARRLAARLSIAEAAAS